MYVVIIWLSSAYAYVYYHYEGSFDGAHWTYYSRDTFSFHL